MASIFDGIDRDSLDTIEEFLKRDLTERELQEVGLLATSSMDRSVSHEEALPSPEYAADLAHLLSLQRMSSSPLITHDEQTPPRKSRKDSGLSSSGVSASSPSASTRPSLASVKSRAGSASSLVLKPSLLSVCSRTGSSSSLGHGPRSSTPVKRRKSAPGDNDDDDDYDNDSDCEDEGTSFSDPFSANRPKLSWTVNELETWHRIFDDSFVEIPQPAFRVEVDKGLRKSIEDDAFISQKKNHFQVTAHVKMNGIPSLLTAKEGLLKIEGLVIVLYGIKVESPTSQVHLDQSSSDRTKQPFAPIEFMPVSDQIEKVVVPRLHFSETTVNNMRKKGKRNPDQRYFALVATLAARCKDKFYAIASLKSEKLIVRASNPGQFETEQTVSWVKGQTLNSLHHSGCVGINMDAPTEALCVHGNISLSGMILQPSDFRIKTNIARITPKEELDKLNKLNLVNYAYADGWKRDGNPQQQSSSQQDTQKDTDTGVLAQELRAVFPDAVKLVSNPVKLADGSTITDFHCVNKDRIYMANIAATQYLSHTTEELHSRLASCEAMIQATAEQLARARSTVHHLLLVIAVLVVVLAVLVPLVL